MNFLFEIIIVTLIAVGNLVMGTIVYLKERKNNVNRTFGAFAFFLTMWIVGAFVSELPNNLYLSLILSRIVYVNVVLVSIALFYFSIFFSEKKLGSLISFIIFGTGFVLICATLITDLIIKSAVFQVWGFNLVSGPLYFSFLGYILILAVASIYNLFSLYYKSAPRRRLQLIYFLLGFAIFIVINVIFNVFVRQITGSDVYYRLGNYSSIFLIGFITYAIVKKELFGIKVILTESLVGLVVLILLVDLFLSKTIQMALFKLSILIAFIYLGWSLIRSVLSEIERREKVERMSEELRKAYNELKKLDLAKNEFISIASHQLRTPLTIIKGYISMILEKTYGRVPVKAQGPLKNVYESNERLIRLVNDLLTVSKIEAGKMEVKFEKAKVEKLIIDLKDQLKLKVKEKHLYLRFKKPKGPLPEMLIDKDKIRGAILNILENAIHYTEKGGIKIETKVEDGLYEIVIRDTGAGMTKEEISRLFISFSRGPAGNKMWTEGVGLGLYVANKYIIMHKGKIWVESGGKGKGAAFHILLPVKKYA